MNNVGPKPISCIYASIYFLWGFHLIIWNLTHTSVVYKEIWLQDKEFEKSQIVIIAMYHVRNLILYAVVLTCAVFIIILIVCLVIYIFGCAAEKLEDRKTKKENDEISELMKKIDNKDKKIAMLEIKIKKQDDVI